MIKLKKIAIAVILLLLYSLVSFYSSSFIFPSLSSILKDLYSIITSGGALIEILFTIKRVILGFFITLFFSILFAFFSKYFKFFDCAIVLLNSIIKAVPMASVILIFFYYIRSDRIPIISSAFISFPVLFLHIRNKLQNLDDNLDRLCKVYSIKGIKKIVSYEFLSILPNVLESSKIAFSLIVKVVVSSEIIVYIKKGIGREIENASLMFDSSKLFSWTVVAILLCMILEKFFDITSFYIRKRYNMSN